MSRKKVLITGAAGFLGSHLCDRFIKEGFDVIGMDNLITGDIKNIEHLFSNSNFARCFPSIGGRWLKGNFIELSFYYCFIRWCIRSKHCTKTFDNFDHSWWIRFHRNLV